RDLILQLSKSSIYSTKPLHVETIDEIKNTLCPYCKMLISKEEITRQIQSNVARRIEAMLGGLK
ncbi:hypothetical protein MKZ29_25940, partial [Klebsiella pneumoniae]